MEAKVVLNVKNVTKKFGERKAVNNISFKIHEGEIFGFLGPNGAGKTTTMKMICGLTKITQGEIDICGKSITGDREYCLSKLGAMIETPLMYGYMSGYDNLKYYATLHNGITKENILSNARVVGLQNRMKDKVKTYSLGMKQRLGIAQALLNNPKILVLDEPLSGLDPAGVKEIRDFLKYLARKQKIAIFISSHMLSEMEMLCDTIGIINNGSLLEVKHIKTLKEGLKGEKRIRIKVDYPNFAGSVVIKNLKLPVEIVGNSILVKAEEKQVSTITKCLLDNKVNIFGIEFIEKTLEEVFMEIIEKKTNGKSSIF